MACCKPQRQQVLLGDALLAVGELVTGGGQGDLRVVVRRDVLEGPAQRHHRAGRVGDRLGEHADLADAPVVGVDHPEGRGQGVTLLRQPLPEALHHRLVGRHHVAVQIGQRNLRARARCQAEQAERRVGPAHGAGDEVFLPAAEAAEPLRVIQDRGQAVGRVVPVPGEDHPVEEPGHPQVGQGRVSGFGLVRRQPAGQRLAQRAGDILAHPVRQDLPGPGEQARAGHAGRIGLEQGEPGQVDVGSARPAGSRKAGLTCSMLKSASSPSASLMARTTSTDSARSSSRV